MSRGLEHTHFIRWETDGKLTFRKVILHHLLLEKCSICHAHILEWLKLRI